MAAQRHEQDPRVRRVRRLVGDLRTAATMPRVAIVLSRGAAEEEEILRSFRRPHPRYRVVGRNAVGAALLPLDDFADVDEYLAGLRYARRRVRRAARLGYTVGTFDPRERRGELLAINTSLPERQGRPMDAGYVDAEAEYPTGPDLDYLGVFRGEALVAYTMIGYAGDLATLSRIMGHGDYLADGTMFFLTAGVVEHVKRVRPQTRYLFYDMFFGAADGLREFKAHLGFRPYFVRWKREPRAAVLGAQT
jgi:hypothetical protein